MELQDAVAVVSGGASGIGRGIVLALVRAGASVVIADVNDARARSVFEEIEALGGRGAAIHWDVASEADVQSVTGRVLGDWGRVDVLVNNAGVQLYGPVERTPVADWQWILDVNLLGAVRLLRAFVPGMLERGRGHVVTTASMQGFVATHPFNVPYVSTKAALIGMSEGLALRLRPHGVGVSVFCAGPVPSNIRETRRVAGMPADAPVGASLFPGVSNQPVTAEVAGQAVVDGIRGDRFLILTHPDHEGLIRSLWDDPDARIARQISIHEDPANDPFGLRADGSTVVPSDR